MKATHLTQNSNSPDGEREAGRKTDKSSERHRTSSPGQRQRGKETEKADPSNPL